jgi:hypothetical protein
VIFTRFGAMPAPGLIARRVVVVVIALLLDAFMIWLFTLPIDDVLIVCNFSAFPPIALAGVVIGWWTSPTTI